jgi:hydrogenase maturation protease
LSEPTRKTAVVGVGNVLMGDDGIGVQVVWALERQTLPDGIELFDGGTVFQALAGQLTGFHKLIIVDAVHGGDPPGTIYRFTLEEILGKKRRTQAPPGSLGALSLHDVGVIEALMLERLAESTSPGRALSLSKGGSAADLRSTVIIGIEPAKVELSMKLSPTLRQRFPVLVQTILEECAEEEEPS